MQYAVIKQENLTKNVNSKVSSLRLFRVSNRSPPEQKRKQLNIARFLDNLSNVVSMNIPGFAVSHLTLRILCNSDWYER